MKPTNIMLVQIL